MFEKYIKCPCCSEMMPEVLLVELNHCDNCQLPAKDFDYESQIGFGM